MGTHPIFESDFDCLTENGFSERAFDLESEKGERPRVRLQLWQQCYVSIGRHSKRIPPKSLRHFDRTTFNDHWSFCHLYRLRTNKSFSAKQPGDCPTIELFLLLRAACPNGQTPAIPG